MVTGLRIFSAFILGAIVYVLGFLIGAFAGNVSAWLATILPSVIVREEIWAGAAALAANIGSFAIFAWVYPKTKSRRIAGFVWVSILTIFAVGYAVLCVVSGDFHLLIYSGCCVIPLIVMFSMVIKKDF